MRFFIFIIGFVVGIAFYHDVPAKRLLERAADANISARELLFREYPHIYKDKYGDWAKFETKGN